MRFIIVGGTPAGNGSRSESDRETRNIQNVRLTGRVPHREIPQWLASADILLMMWTWKVSTIRVCSPMKLFEYMAAKRLIVGPAFPTVLEVMEDGRDAILLNLTMSRQWFRPAEARIKMSDTGHAGRGLSQSWRLYMDGVLPQNSEPTARFNLISKNHG